MNDTVERLKKAEQYFLAAANGDITAPEALHAECCHRAAKQIAEIEYLDIPYFLRAPGAVGEDVKREFEKLQKQIKDLEKEYATEINKRVPVEQRLLDSARGAKPLPDKEECLKMARILGRNQDD